MVWVIAFGELFFGDLWCVVWGYGGMRTHFSLLNPGCIQIAWGRQRPDPGPEARETYAADRTGLYQARGVPHPGPERRNLTCLGQHRAGLRKQSCARYMATSAAKGAAGHTRPSAT